LHEEFNNSYDIPAQSIRFLHLFVIYLRLPDEILGKKVQLSTISDIR